MSTLVFGASGTIGSAVCNELTRNGESVVKISRSRNEEDFVSLQDSAWFQSLPTDKSHHSLIFAQGQNANDSVIRPSHLADLIQTNLVFIIETISQLLEHDAIGKGSKIVVVSSVWQEFSRPNKLSYSVSKSALRGLVSSLVADLSPMGIRVNAVLPGVIDSPMTRQMLPTQLLAHIESETPTRHLVSKEEVAKVVAWLTSEASEGIVGQFIRVDNGWTNVRLFS